MIIFILQIFGVSLLHFPPTLRSIPDIVSGNPTLSRIIIIFLVITGVNNPSISHVLLEHYVFLLCLGPDSESLTGDGKW